MVYKGSICHAVGGDVTNPFIERHRDQISGVLPCFDRVIITGTLPDIGYAEAMVRHLNMHHTRLFDYTQWAEPLRDEIRHNAERLAEEAGLEIEFIRKLGAFRKEARIKEILAQRGEHAGLVHIFSAMEACTAYRPWHDKLRHTTTLKPTSGKCLHYYFYFIDEVFGLCYVRVPTWAPFRLQVYFNGHSWLAQRLTKAEIAFAMADNAFLDIADPDRAQAIADSLDAKQLHRRLNRWAKSFCPVSGHFPSGYHWSFMQVELATDVVFRSQGDFQPLYESIIRTAVHTVRAENIATFLGRKLTSAYQGEVGNDFHTRIQGTRIRHHMGPVSIKLYDKAGIMARVECTANDVSFFKHYREVEQHDGGGYGNWRRCARISTVCACCANSCMRPMSAIWPSSPRSITPPPASKLSTQWPNLPVTRTALTGDSTCSSNKIWICFSPLPGVNGPSVIFAPPICAHTSTISRPPAPRIG
jgi:hypothetical protein